MIHGIGGSQPFNPCNYISTPFLKVTILWNDLQAASLQSLVLVIVGLDLAQLIPISIEMLGNHGSRGAGIPQKGAGEERHGFPSENKGFASSFRFFR